MSLFLSGNRICAFGERGKSSKAELWRHQSNGLIPFYRFSSVMPRTCKIVGFSNNSGGIIIFHIRFSYQNEMAGDFKLYIYLDFPWPNGKTRKIICLLSGT